MRIELLGIRFTRKSQMLLREREMRKNLSIKGNRSSLDKSENLRKSPLLELKVLIQLKLAVTDCLRRCQLLSLENG